jgi:hypothetical protein
MKEPTAAVLTAALAVLVLSALAAGAVPAPPATTPIQATPLQGGDCGLKMYSCQTCVSSAAPLLKLCYTQICGNFVIENCGDCQTTCHLPPS